MRRFLARSLALAIGGFLLVSLAMSLIDPAWDAAGWVVDLEMLPRLVRGVTLSAIAALLVLFALRPTMGAPRTRATVAAATVLAAAAACNAATCWRLQSSGAIDAWSPVPFSALVAAAMLLVAFDARRPRAVEPGCGYALMPCGAAAFALLASLLLMVQFGKTDYRRPADAIVVLGARVYADGTLSDALADRVRTACEAHAQGLAPLVLMSGGPGDGSVHETEAMRDFAIALGVPSEAILLDRGGVSTRATVGNTAAMLAELGLGRVLVVSHFYHLPRLKMGYQRVGLKAYTVPARESYTLTKMPIFVLREVAAFWVYFAMPPSSGTSSTTT